jgi:predicted ribosome-associated RNA-binding protein Tma20
VDTRGSLETIFLEIEFKGQTETTNGKNKRKIMISVDLSTEGVFEWLRAIVDSGGVIALSDSLDLHVPGILVTNVPLDLPKEILNFVGFKGC